MTVELSSLTQRTQSETRKGCGCFRVLFASSRRRYWKSPDKFPNHWGFAKWVSQTMSPLFFLKKKRKATERTGKKRKETERNGRNGKKQGKTEKRKKGRNAKKKRSDTVPATPFAKCRNHEMLCISGLRAPRKANLSRTLGRHCPERQKKHCVLLQ